MLKYIWRYLLGPEDGLFPPSKKVKPLSIFGGAPGCDFMASIACRFFLARASPLLADTVAVGKGGQVHASVSPAGMCLPSEAYTIRVDPLRLTVGRGQLLDRLVSLLQAGQVSLVMTSPPSSSGAITLHWLALPSHNFIFIEKRIEPFMEMIADLLPTW